MNIDFEGTYMYSEYVIPIRKKRKCGAILNWIHVAINRARHEENAYSASRGRTLVILSKWAPITVGKI